MTPGLTHYIPAFTRVVAGGQLAVCGTGVSKQAHSSEPTCPVCVEWLRREAEDIDETARALEMEFPNDFAGKLVTR